jgi:hypothetical protein
MVVGGGGGVKLMEARLRLKSPAIVTQRRVERGFVKVMDCIPGSTLRGAILTALFRGGRLSQADLRREAEEPSLLASPAYPIVGGAKSVPATPFMFRCRRCGSIVDATRESVERLQRKEEPELPLLHKREGRECEEPLKPLYGSLVVKARDGLQGVSRVMRGFRATSVAIGKDRGSAVREMLFDYEAIAEGTEFWAWVLAPDWLQAGSMEVAVGRGQSRGFGWADLKLEPAPQQPQLSQGAFVALSPLAPLKRLEWSGSTLSLTKVFGRTTSLQAGWDYVRGFRPIVELARRGSIALARASGEAAPLRVGLPVKAGDSWLTGVNALLPIDEYYRLLGG